MREVDPISLLSLVDSRKQVTHRSWHVLSEKGSMMNAAKMMNLKPRFQITRRVFAQYLKDMKVCKSHLLVYKLTPGVEQVT